MDPLLVIKLEEFCRPVCEFCDRGLASVYVGDIYSFLCEPCLQDLTATVYIIDHSSKAELN